MKPIQLLLPDGSPSNVWKCAKCGQVYSKWEYGAEQCCDRKCNKCGTSIDKMQCRCSGCQTKFEADLEQKRYAEAEKVTTLGEKEWLWVDDIYAEGPEELAEMLWDKGEEVPAYAWVCPPSPILTVDPDRVIEWATDDCCIEGWDSSCLSGVKEFSAACEAFEKANARHLSYLTDYKRAYLIPEEIRQKYAAMED